MLTKKCIWFQTQSKIDNFRKNMQILQILIHHFKYFMSCNVLQNIWSNDPYQNKDILKF